MLRILLLLFLACGSTVAAAEPAELIRQLADPRFPVREAAAKELLKRGAEALPEVRLARDATDDPAIRERTEALLPRLQRIADSQQVLAVRRSTYHYREAPLTQIVEDLKKRTGIPLILAPERVANPLRPVSFQGSFTPWEAVESLRLAAGLVEEHLAELPLPKGANGASGNIQITVAFRIPAPPFHSLFTHPPPHRFF